ncbi:hypothetical protein Pla175_50210 [Pirellulimonas nuda]|uniref:Uncharacterized protein n=1 Tax=Pirellulimonas nuda TaxID=2528009 RepID=A0A518DJC9_9BACT|nr:hypothetical protein [Pirellulimonas nuda]QDU91591.1 hypothetical protein Pla175_50210 [Pirellulimonas nuda]
MRNLLVTLIASFAVSAQAAGLPDRVVVHLLDPRGAIDGEQTIPTEWNGGKADLIGTRRLNVTEAKKLRILLRKELADDEDVPFCGHSPAYAVSITSRGKPTSTVTLCGTCGTWARNGDLRVLHGKASLEYLDTLLPLPEVFRPVAGKPAKILMPFHDGVKLPFQQIDNPDAE